MCAQRRPRSPHSCGHWAKAEPHTCQHTAPQQNVSEISAVEQYTYGRRGARWIPFRKLCAYSLITRKNKNANGGMLPCLALMIVAPTSLSRPGCMREIGVRNQPVRLQIETTTVRNMQGPSVIVPGVTKLTDDGYEYSAGATARYGGSEAWLTNLLTTGQSRVLERISGHLAATITVAAAWGTAFEASRLGVMPDPVNAAVQAVRCQGLVPGPLGHYQAHLPCRFAAFALPEGQGSRPATTERLAGDAPRPNPKPDPKPKPNPNHRAPCQRCPTVSSAPLLDSCLHFGPARPMTDFGRPGHCGMASSATCAAQFGSRALATARRHHLSSVCLPPCPMHSSSICEASAMSTS